MVCIPESFQEPPWFKFKPRRFSHTHLCAHNTNRFANVGSNKSLEMRCDEGFFHLRGAVPMLVVLPPAVVKDDLLRLLCFALVVAFRSRTLLSDTDKKLILEVYYKGEESFGGINEEERR